MILRFLYHNCAGERIWRKARGFPAVGQGVYPNRCICRLWLNRVFNANDICNRTMSFLQSAYRTPCNSDQQDNFERYEFHRCISVFFQLPAFTVSSHVRTSIDSASNLISPSFLIFASSLDNEVR